MALPILNDKPKYVMTIPSTGQEVKYRPYLVKEEKILMMALESQDKSQAMNAIVDTIVACVEDHINKNILTVFDIEYAFLKIRSKSVGEKVSLGLKCSECEHINDVSVNIDNIEVPVVKKGSENIKITDNITIKMKYPNFTDMVAIEKLNNISETDKTFKIIIKCMESVQTDEENLLIKDEKEEDVMNFIESLSSTQFELIRDFVEAMPRVEHTIDYKCEGCGHDNHLDLKGIEDFF